MFLDFQKLLAECTRDLDRRFKPKEERPIVKKLGEKDYFYSKITNKTCNDAVRNNIFSVRIKLNILIAESSLVVKPAGESKVDFDL